MIEIQEVGHFLYEVRKLVHLQNKGRIFLGQMQTNLEHKSYIEPNEIALSFALCIFEITYLIISIRNVHMLFPLSYSLKNKVLEFLFHFLYFWNSISLKACFEFAVFHCFIFFPMMNCFNWLKSTRCASILNQSTSSCIIFSIV